MLLSSMYKSEPQRWINFNVRKLRTEGVDSKVAQLYIFYSNNMVKPQGNYLMITHFMSLNTCAPMQHTTS